MGSINIIIQLLILDAQLLRQLVGATRPGNDIVVSVHHQYPLISQYVDFRGGENVPENRVELARLHGRILRNCNLTVLTVTVNVFA